MVILYGHKTPSVHYWCQDESRLGLKTITRRRLTSRRIKPLGQVQWSFQADYLDGMIEPLTGESFFVEFSHLNTDGFQADLDEFSRTYPHQLHIIQMDNATCHTTKRLKVPENIILWFQPPPSPDGNPIERFWAGIKGPLAWHLFDNLEPLQAEVALILKTLSHSFLSSLTGKKRLLAELAIVNNTSLYKFFYN
jgi:transposase